MVPWAVCNLARRVFEYGPGALLGASDFFMNGPARFRVVAAEPCRLLCLSRESLQRMMRQEPEERAWHHVPMFTFGAAALARHRALQGWGRVIRACTGVKPAVWGRHVPQCLLPVVAAILWLPVAAMFAVCL
jgi:hypothetical protein